MSKIFTVDALRSDLGRALDIPGGVQVDRTKVNEVLDLAFRHHDGQFREHREGGENRVPYITHPVGVAKIAARLWPFVNLDDGINDVLAICLTHDLLEDTAVEVSELIGVTSPRVAEVVTTLTKPAVSDFTSREERNDVFVRLIAAGGATAKFVKICDALHNLSRPESMPATLLRKTLRKAKRDFLPFAFDERFGTEVRVEFENAIDRFEQFGIEDAEGGATPIDLDQYLRYCIERSSGKVLESHDVLDILLELPGIRKVFDGTVTQFIDGFLRDLLTDANSQVTSRIVDRLDRRSELILSGRPFVSDQTRRLPFDRVLAMPFDTGVKGLERRRFFFLGRNDKQAPPWVNAVSVRAVVSILTERHRDREARELADYASWISEAAIALDPRSASRLRLTREQILSISRMIEGAHIAIGAVRAGLDSILRLGEFSGAVLLKEDRIKSPPSLAKKLVGRMGGDWTMMDDLMGFRVVFLSNVARCRFVEVLRKRVEDKDSHWGRDIRMDLDSFQVRDVNSASGYRAIHIHFGVSNALSDIGSIACEIQARTVFEDAWARVAHATTYKSKGQIPRPLKRNLRSLSEICEKADETAAQFPFGD